MTTNKLELAVEEAILGGCTVVQLREKNCSSLEFFETAIKIKKITDRHKVPLIINDRIDIALAVDASGVHIGQSDIPAKSGRKLIGENKILGVSASTYEEIRKYINLPIVVIGGINENTIPKFVGVGIDGIAVASAIISQTDIKIAAQGLKAMFNEKI